MTYLKFIRQHWQDICLSIVLLLGLAARLYKIDSPLADWHSWRQADTASVTREYVKHTFPLLEPRFHDLSNIPSGLDNPTGYRMVEFPVLNILVAQLVKLNPGWDLVVTSRAVSIFLSLISILCLYHLVFRLSGNKSVALLSSSFFAFLPYSIFYSRVILPEPGLIAMMLLSLTCLLEWIRAYQEKKMQKRMVYILFSFLSLTLALLLKPTALLIVPVMAVALIMQLGVFKSLKAPELWMLPLSVIPLWWWRNWIEQFREGIPAASWLFNGNGIRLKPAWWRWLFGDRLGRLILGYWGIAPFIGGLVSRFPSLSKQKMSVFDATTWTWAASGFAYLAVIATGNVQHDYYQAILIPIISILLARGVYWLVTLPTSVAYKPGILVALGLSVALLFALSWYEVRGYFSINNPAIVAAGKRVDQLTPPTAKVIAPYMGDTAFLFQTNRTGWPIGFEIEKKIKLGATHYVSTSYDDEARELEKQYTLMEKTSNYIIIDLTQPKLIP